MSTTTNYITTFKQYSIWKQAAVSSAIITGSTIAYTLGSYYFCKLRYPSKPSIKYTTIGDINNNNGILVFIHGFPDFEYLWDKQVEHFKAKNYCCITLELPNYHIDRIQNPWGYDLFVVIDAISDTIKQLLNDKECCLIAHDWGSLLAQLLYLNYKTEINFSHLIILDVGDGVDKKDKVTQSKLVYQLHMAACFILPPMIGTFYLNYYSRNNEIFANNNEGIPLWEKEKKDNKTYYSSLQCYMYYHTIKAILTGNAKSISIRSRLNEYDGLPILFINGNKTPLRFYTDKFKEFLEERSYCKFLDFDCSHWIPTDKPDELNDAISQFIK